MGGGGGGCDGTGVLRQFLVKLDEPGFLFCTHYSCKLSVCRIYVVNFQHLCNQPGKANIPQIVVKRTKCL